MIQNTDCLKMSEQYYHKDTQNSQQSHNTPAAINPQTR